jgi:hypothetical protein
MTGVAPFAKQSAEHWRLDRPRPRKTPPAFHVVGKAGELRSGSESCMACRLAFVSHEIGHLLQDGSQVHCAALRIGKPPSNQILTTNSGASTLSINCHGRETVCLDSRLRSPMLTGVLLPEGLNSARVRQIVLENCDTSLGIWSGSSCWQGIPHRRSWRHR